MPDKKSNKKIIEKIKTFHELTIQEKNALILRNTIQIDDHHSISYQHITYPATLVEAYQTMMDLFPMIRILF